MDSNILLGVTQVASAAALIYLTYKLSKSTSDYSTQVGIQTGIMTRNTDLSQETLESEENNRRRDALIKEMDNLIGPLYSKIERYRTLEPLYLDAKTEEESRIFWEKIRENEYLAQADLRTRIDDYLKIMSIIGSEYKKARQHLSRAIMERHSELSRGRTIPEGEDEFRLIEQNLLVKMKDDVLIQPVPLTDRENAEWLHFWDKIRQNKTIQGTDLRTAMNEYYDTVTNGQPRLMNPRSDLRDTVKRRLEANFEEF